jgi:hypothetical protein
MNKPLKNTTGKKYKRMLSFNERTYLVADRLNPPIVNQMVCEGEGILDAGIWQKAVDVASAANPGCRVRLKGFLRACRWVDTGYAPRVREIDAGPWSGYSSADAPFLRETFSVTSGPTCEVLLIHGNPNRVAFRTHHAVMDGRGTKFWAEEIFRALRHESLKGSRSTLTDWDVALSFQNIRRKAFPHNNLPPTGKPEGTDQGFSWCRRKVIGRFRKLLAQVAYLAAGQARTHSSGKVHFGVPVDLRSRVNGLDSTGNLTMAIYIDVEPDLTVEQIADDIKRQIAEKRDGMIDRWDFLQKFVPLRLMQLEGQRRIDHKHRTGIYSLSGILTNPGKIDLGNFEGGGFITDSLFFIPPAINYTPFIVTMSGTDTHVELLFGAPNLLATRGRLEKIADVIVSNLEGRSANKR